MPRLLVISGPDQGKQFELSGHSVLVGRDASSQLRLHDTEISRRHAEFKLLDGGYKLLDMGSANGTYVNNQRVREHRLVPGDHIAIGQTVLLFTGDRPTTPPNDLAERISLIARGDFEVGSAIVKTVHESHGSRILKQASGTSPWLQTALANLSIMYEASQAVSHILEIDELLQRILELLFRSISADRGCILLRKGEGELQPHAGLWRDEERQGENITVSMSIVEHVLKERVGLLLSDAARDERFGAGQSVIRQGIREVLCVPMKGRHETLGVFYLDTQSSHGDAVRRSGLGKFTEDHLNLAIAVAHQAALAVEETRYHQAMIQAERLAAIGQTIAALSHHIKNILQGLKSGNEIIKMGLKDKNDNLIEKGWKITERNQGRIYDLVMDMLNYSKDRVPAVEKVQINELVTDVVELIEARAKERGVAIEVSLQDDLPEIHVDSEGIHRSLLNIVGNAIDAVEDRPEPKVTVGTRVSDEGFVRILVIDNGPGISPLHLPEIFKPFVSSKGSRGTGLGLPVSRKILREHGGDLLVQSQVGVGSRFVLKLPIKSPLVGDPGLTLGDMPILPPEAD